MVDGTCRSAQSLGEIGYDDLPVAKVAKTLGEGFIKNNQNIGKRLLSISRCVLIYTSDRRHSLQDRATFSPSLVSPLFQSEAGDPSGGLFTFCPCSTNVACALRLRVSKFLKTGTVMAHRGDGFENLSRTDGHL